MPMPENEAFLDSYGGYDLELPSGEVIHARALTLEQAARFMKLLRRADGTEAVNRYLEECEERGEPPTEDGMERAVDEARGDMARAQRKIMDEFPTAVGAEEQFRKAHITPGEFFDAVRRFMGLRRPERTRTTNGRPAGRTTDGEPRPEESETTERPGRRRTSTI